MSATLAPTVPPADTTLADLHALLGPIPLRRIRTDPPPGAATQDDVIRIRHESGALCELIDGVLVEKAVSTYTGVLGGEILALLRNFVRPRRLGWVVGADGFLRISDGRLRAPDVSFIRRAQFPDGRLPQRPGFLNVAPDLAVEVLSPGNTREEMQTKRNEYFAAGTQSVWIVDPRPRTVEVWTDAVTCRTLGETDALDGGNVLPGFTTSIRDLFAAGDLN